MIFSVSTRHQPSLIMILPLKTITSVLKFLTYTIRLAIILIPMIMSVSAFETVVILYDIFMEFK